MEDMEIGILVTHLAEVFTIKINKIKDGSEKREVYGTIRVQDKEGTLYLYDRSVENAECVSGNRGTLSLIARERPIDASRNFKVYFDLKDKSGNEFISNSFSVDLSHIDCIPFKEKCHITDVEGKMGVATVNFTVLQVAVLSCIRVHLVKQENDSDDHDDDVHVYGSLVTRYYGKFEVKEDARIVLLDKIAKEPVRLKKEDKYEIPLSRDFVVVPVYCSIVVEGDVHCCYSDGRVEAVKISERIPASDIRQAIKEFKGEYGSIKLTVFGVSSFYYREYCDLVLDRPSS